MFGDRTMNGLPTIALIIVSGLTVPAAGAAVSTWPGSPSPGTGFMPSGSGGAERDLPGGPRLHSLLADAFQRSASAETIATAVEALGSASIPAILDLLEAGRFQQRLGNGGAVVHRLQGAYREGLEVALRRFQWETVRRHIERRVQESPSEARRASLIGVLGAVVPPGALGELLLPLEGLAPSARRRLRRASTSSLKRALTRTPSGESPLLPELPRFFEQAPAEMLAGTIEVAASLDADAALRSLSGFLGTYPEADPLILVEVADVAKRAPRPVPQAVLAPIRRMLIVKDSVSVVESAKALGRLDDVEVIPELIQLLRSQSEVVQKEARYSLERLSAERFGGHADAWQDWYATAQEWLRHEAPAVRGDIGSSDPTRVSRALLQVARYRVFRHELDGEVVGAALRSDGQTGVVACAVLGHFGTAKSVAALLKILGGNGEDELRRAALEALQRATGENHGEDVAAWVAAGHAKTL